MRSGQPIFFFKLFFVLFFFYCTSAQSQNTSEAKGKNPLFNHWQIHGKGEVLLQFFPDKPYPGIVDEQLNLDGQLELRYQPNPFFEFYLEPRIRIDPLLSERNRYEPLEGYLDFQFENEILSWNLRVGQMIESWAIVDTYNLADVLNRQDIEGNFFDPEKLGELMVRTHFTLPDQSFLTSNSLSLYFLPLHRETPLPANKSRFRFAPNAGELPLGLGPLFGILDEDRAFFPNAYANRLSYALRAQTSIQSADLFALYYGGPSRTPSLQLNPLTGFLNPVYYRSDFLGGGMQWAMDRVLFKTEFGYTFTRWNGLSFPLTLAVPPSFFQYVVGVDYTFYEVVAKDSITLTLEYAGEDNRSVTLQGLRPFKNDLFLALLWEFHDAAQSQFLASASVDLGNGESLFELALERKLVGELKALLRGNIILREQQQFTVFGLFPPNSSISFGLAYSF
jgi:hypothetical protein